eukprot:4116042-Pyramimonas_sp.AAC.1
MATVAGFVDAWPFPLHQQTVTKLGVRDMAGGNDIVFKNLHAKGLSKVVKVCKRLIIRLRSNLRNIHGQIGRRLPSRGRSPAYRTRL